MTNIFTYVGNRNSDSRTMKFTKKIVNDVLLANPNATLDFHTPLDMNLMHATGCKTCFTQGYCPSEKKEEDYGNYLKNKLQNSDIIFIASPVYSHNVSSDIKILVDRLSYWGHIFKLIGKKVVILVTAESNGDYIVVDYLTKVFRVMGAEVYHTVSFVNSEKDLTDDLIEETIDVIDDLIKNPKEFNIHPNQESTFNAIKPIIQNYHNNNFEYQYWKENRLFDYDSLNDWYKAEVLNNE